MSELNTYEINKLPMHEACKPEFANDNIVKTWASSEELCDRLCAYFDWSLNNRVTEERISVDGNSKLATYNPSPLSIQGACAFVGMDIPTWDKYKTQSAGDYPSVIKWADNIIIAVNFSNSTRQKLPKQA